MAEPVTPALVAAKQDEVRSLVRRLAEAAGEATDAMARLCLEEALSGKVKDINPGKDSISNA